MNLTKTSVSVDTKNNFVKIGSGYGESLFKTNPGFFTPINNYRFYYEGSNVLHLLQGGRKFWDSNALKACVFILLYAFDEFKKDYTTSDEEEREVLKNSYLNNLIQYTSINEIKEDLAFYTRYGLAETPSQDFIDISLMGGSYFQPSFLNGLVYKILNFSIYNITSSSLEYFSYTQVKKTFETFETFKPEVHTSVESIVNNLPLFAEELYNSIKGVFDNLSQEEFDVCTLSINSSPYNIKYIKSGEEKIYLEKLKNSFSTALTEYKKALEADDATKASNIKKDLFKDYYTLNGTYEPINTSYRYFAQKWIYYMIYKTNNLTESNYSRSSVFRSKGLIIYNLSRLNNPSKLSSSLKGIINTFDGEVLATVIKTALTEEGSPTYLLETIKSDIEKELSKIEEEINTKVDAVFGTVRLKYVNPEFAKKLYTNEEKILFEKISEYWDSAFKEYKDYLSAGKNDKAGFLKGIILGDDDPSNTIGLNEGNYSLGLYGTEFKEPSVFIEETKDYWTIGTRNISSTEHMFETLKDKKTYNIVDLFSYFNFYFYERKVNPESVEGKYNLYTYNVFRRDHYPEKLSFAVYRNTTVKEERDVFRRELKKEIESVLNSALEEATEDNEIQDKINKELESAKLYEEKEEEILKRKVTVDRFFYIKEKHIPIGKAVDVEFYVYDREFNKARTISVSRRINDIVIKKGEFYEDNYFSSLELKDLGGNKEIELVLKSAEETNLEDIIYNSMIGPINRYNTNENSSNTIQEMYNLIKQQNVNFRVRFGYSDNYGVNGSIESDDMFGTGFKNRVPQKVEDTKPVRITPWMDFKITDITSRTIGNILTFEIKGISVGEDLLDNFVMFSTNQGNFTYKNVKPKQGLASFGGLIMKASGGKVVVLGDENQVIESFKNEEIIQRKIIFQESYTRLDGSFKDLPYEWNFGNTSNRNFGTIGLKRESDLILKKGNDKREITVKEMLKIVSNWLPKKFYITAKDKTGQYAQEYNPAEHQGLAKKSKDLSIVGLSPDFEIFEAKARLENESEFSDKIVIRFFYKGPTVEEDKSRVRFYSFKHKQETVVRSLTINNEVNIGNIKSYCSVVSMGKDAIFSSNYIVSEENKWPKNGIISEVNGVEGTDVVLVPKKNALKEQNMYEGTVDVKDRVEAEETIKSYLSGVASNHLNNMERWPFEGELEIMGDPYYLFDDKLKMGSHMIYIDINRANRLAEKSDNFIKRSYYTGIYLITGIEHSITENGDFSTRLKIVKDVTR